MTRFVGGAGVIGFLCPPWTSGCPDCCHWRPEHTGRVRAVGVAQLTSRTSSSIAPEELEQPTQQIRDQLEESITEKVTRQLMLSLSQIQSQFQSQMQSQGLALPLELEVGPSTARVSTKRSYFDPSANDPDMVKVGVEEVKDLDAPVPVSTDKALNTFLAWPTHLVKCLSEQGAVGPAKPTDRPDPEVDDPLYLIILTIPQLFLKPLQVMWDATMFGLFNSNFPLYIKHEDMSEIAQVVNVLASLHLTKTSMRLGNFDVYGFLESQSIQRSGQSHYIKNWMQNSKWDVYLGAYLNGLDNYLKGIINRPVLFFNTFALALGTNINISMFLVFNSALKGLDDTPQPKSKVGVRWIVVKYFNDVRPLESNTLKALRIQWANYYLKVRNET
ncbi:hypothetical protein HKD37_06G017307 [Glycine soja]